MVGLIEACKGIQELYPDVLGPGRGYGHGSTGSAGGTGTGAGSNSSSSTVTEAVLSAAEAHTQLQVGGTRRDHTSVLGMIWMALSKEERHRG